MGIGDLVWLETMTDEMMVETGAKASHGLERFNINWRRVEGVMGVGALLTSFIWFLGMPTGMAIGVGFGIILLLDFIRSLIFDSSRSNQSEYRVTESTQH